MKKKKEFILPEKRSLPKSPSPHLAAQNLRIALARFFQHGRESRVACTRGLSKLVPTQSGTLARVRASHDVGTPGDDVRERQRERKARDFCLFMRA